MKSANLLSNGSHRLSYAPNAPRPYRAPEPSMEDLGNGWFKIIGDVHGPLDRFGLESALSTLAKVRAARGTSTTAPEADIVPSKATLMGHGA